MSPESLSLYEYQRRLKASGVWWAQHLPTVPPPEVTYLTATLDALATECQTLRGMLAATPRRWWRPAMAINLAPPPATPRRWAFLRAFWRVRRAVWTERESRLVAKWESYG